MKAFEILRSRFFWRIYASFTVVLLVTAGVVGFLVDRRVEESLLGGLEDSLRNQCLSFVPYAERALEEGATPRLQERVTTLGRRMQIRITLVLPSGEVIADSAEDPALMDDHGSRPEILESLREGFGSSIRHSHTVRERMLYVAVAVDDQGEPLGFVRFSMPLADVEEQIAAARASVAVGTVAGFVLALVLGLVVTRRSTRPIAEVTAIAERMRSGDYEALALPRPTPSSHDEVALLADTLGRLGAEVTRRIAVISREDARLRAMLSAMVEGVVAVDEDDRVTFCNGAAVRLLEVEGDPLGRRLWEVAPIAELEELLEGARGPDATGSSEIELHRSGRERIVSAHSRPFRGGGRSGVVIVLNDVSDLRRLERIRRDFVANVSHELKTPLTSIKGFVETLLAGALEEPENAERFLRRIDANVERLTHLVTDLLSLARIESQGDDLQLEPVDWRAVLTPVLARHEDALRQKSLVLETRGTESSHLVLGDFEAMTQVLDNLLDNAIKYASGSGTVRVGLEDRDGTCVLSVQDEGMGIPGADLDRIFERFYRVDKARSRELGGTGLGLSIVKNLVRSLAGEVRVESEPGVGSTFFVELPRADPA